MAECLLCGSSVSGDEGRFYLAPDAKKVINDTFPHSDSETEIAKWRYCERCRALPQEEKERLIERSVERTLMEFAREVLPANTPPATRAEFHRQLMAGTREELRALKATRRK